MAEVEKRLSNQPEDQIDIIYYLVSGWKMFKKTWWLLIILTALGIAGTYGYKKASYRPVYEASASFVVKAGGSREASSYTTSITIQQLSATFPYILESGALNDVVCEDLGVSSLPGSIFTSVVEDTNLFQIRVRSADPQMAYDILESVIENYPAVARFIIGDTTLTMLDNTGVPEKPANQLSMKRSMAKGAALAIVFYLCIVLLLVMARRTVSSEEDLKRYTAVDCLSNIPEAHLNRRTDKTKQFMLVDQRIAPAFVEAINTLRIRTLRQLKENDGQVVLVTSAGESEGKTTIAANLALSCALKGYKVLMIDGDLRNPSMGRMFGMQQENGLYEVVNGGKNLEEAAVEYEQTHLLVLAGNKPVPNGRIAAVFRSDALKQLMEKCRKEYDFIIIDTPPCGMMQDAAVLSSVSDGVIMVIRQDFTARDRILSAMELLADTNARMLGYVINCEETGIGSYGYGRYGYGHYGYGKYGKYGHYGYGERTEEKREDLSDVKQDDQPEAKQNV